MQNISPIQKFYSGCNIFVTGGTGFLGKLLIEKLLRSTEVGTIYILVREKKGKNYHCRLDELLDDVVFDRLKQECPKYKHKIEAISGDCSVTGLGLSIHDRQKLISHVHIIFHVAATVNFDESIKLAYDINVNGIRNVMELGKQMPQIKSIVHVSTAYSNCHLPIIDEKLYDYALNYDDVGKLLEKLSKHEADEITPRLLGHWPNTYSFTKALAESYIKENSSNLPIGVFRPSIVISTYKEPVEAWIDNFYGPAGICVGVFSGILRVMLCNKYATADLVPADNCISALIASAWDISSKQEQKIDENIPVYNFISSTENPITWNEFLILNKISSSSCPTSKSMYYSYSYITANIKLYWFLILLVHYIPALIVDGVGLLCGRSPKLFSTYKKVHKFIYVLRYFSLRSFTFTNKNVANLWEKCSETDKELFPFSVKQINWLKYFRVYLKGIRIYLMKDPLSTLNEAKKRHKRLKTLHVIVVAALCFTSSLIVWKLLGFLLSTFS